MVLGKIGWVSPDNKVMKVVCDKCLEANRRANRKNQDHWVYAGNFFKIQEFRNKEHKYPTIKCPKGHEIEIDSVRSWPKGRRPYPDC